MANVASRGGDALGSALKVLTTVAVVPALIAPFIVETKGKELG